MSILTHCISTLFSQTDFQSSNVPVAGKVPDIHLRLPDLSSGTNIQKLTIDSVDNCSGSVAA